MDILYELSFYSWNGGYREGFFIGIFSSYDKAEHVAEKFLKEVAGFKDYPCEYTILPKKLIGELCDSNFVHMIWGWNLDEDSDEIDIWESELYVDYDKAEAKLREAKDKYKREEWTIDGYTIDETHWKDGFVRI